MKELLCIKQYVQG